MKLYLAKFRGASENVHYKTEAEICTLGDLKRAVQLDHIAAAMKFNHRSSDNFQYSDCIMLDIDNTHSDNPEDWRTIDDIIDAFPGVAFYYIQSRNYMKVKEVKRTDGRIEYQEPREKYHCYFPLSRTYTDFKEYETLMLKAAGLFPFFDLGAARPAQFFYGVEQPAGGAEEGNETLDDFLQRQPKSAVINAVQAFAEKVEGGEYKQSKEAEKALTRLYNYLGVSRSGAAAEDQRQTTGGDEQYSDLGRRIGEAEQERSLTWLQNWMKSHDIAEGKRYTIKSREHPGAVCICVSCPWEAEHSMNGAENESVIIVELGGKLNYLCRHSHCAGRGWKDYRAFYEKRDEKPGVFDIHNLTLDDNSWMNDTPKPPAHTAQKAPQGDTQNSPNETPSQAATAPGNGTQQGAAATPEANNQLPGLLTYSDAVTVFETADDRYIELKSFPVFSDTAKIRRHDSVVLAADTGAGKSSLALNFLNDLNDEYPVIYINLEMDAVDILRRLTAIYTGIELDRIEGYKHDEKTAEAVNIALQAITNRKPLQVIQGAYMLQQIESVIELSTRGREEPTIIFLDHCLLVDTQTATGGRYDRFTQVSEGLRKMALKYNAVLFVLLQQNRAGKASEDERPRNSSLKESGSWENDATQICFLWYDPADRKKKLLLTKNRHGSCGEFTLNYWKRTQTYTETATQGEPAAGDVMQRKPTKRERARQRLETAYNEAYIKTFGKPTYLAIAEAADVTTATVKAWIKEYGGCIVDGKRMDPAGIDTAVEFDGFVKLTPADGDAFEDAGTGETPKAGKRR